MKRLLLFAALIILSACPTYAQQYRAQQIQSFTAVGTGTALRLIGSGVTISTMSWNVSGGTFATCQAKTEQSADGSTAWSDLIANQTCTSNGSAAFVSGGPNFIRINVGTLTVATGTPTLTVNWTGYASGPSGGGTIGQAVSGGTIGSVLFVGASSFLAQDNANFFWDNSAKRLGIGTIIPHYTLEVAGVGDFGVHGTAETKVGASGLGTGDRGVALFYDNASGFGVIQAVQPAVAWLPLHIQANDIHFDINGGTDQFTMSAAGQLGIGMAIPRATLDLGITTGNINAGPSVGVSTYGASLQAISRHWHYVKDPVLVNASFINSLFYVEDSASVASSVVYGVGGTAEATNSGNANTKVITGMYGQYKQTGSGIVAQGMAVDSSAELDSGQTNLNVGLYNRNYVLGTSFAFINAGLYVDVPTKAAGATLSTNYGAFIADQAIGTAFYSLWTDGAAPSRFGGALIQAAKTTTYNNIATVSNGVPAEYATVDLTAQSAAKTSTLLYTPAATGMFRVSYYAKVTTPGTTSVLGGTTGLVLTFTDGTDSVAQTAFTLPEDNQAGTALSVGTGNTTNTTQAVVHGVGIIYALTGVAINYAFGYTSTGTAMQYELHIKLEAL